MDRPSKETLARMPLAEAVLLLLRWALSEDRLAALWNAHRGRCYEKVITFSVMVKLIADALLMHEGSGLKSFEVGLESGELQASVQAAYGKLRRLPVALSQAFLAECTAALQAAFPCGAVWQLPQSLRPFVAVVVDGKAVKGVPKRLKALQGASGGLLGGRALVAMDWSTGMAIAMHADRDGDANDVRFVKHLAPVIRERIPGPRLFLADSAFCDLTQPVYFTEDEGDHFLVRHHPKVDFHPDSDAGQCKGVTFDELTYTEDWGWMGSEKDKRRRNVRRINLVRPGEETVTLITDLLDHKAIPAEDLLWFYRERWGIEQMFQKVTEVFHLKNLIGGSPEACLFQFSFCLLLYNIIQVVRGYVAQSQELPPDDISTEKMFNEVERQLIAWNVVFEPSTTIEYFQSDPTLAELLRRLATLLSNTWRRRWLRSPPQRRRKKPQPKLARTHQSVARILAAVPPKKPKQPPSGQNP